MVTKTLGVIVLLLLRTRCRSLYKGVDLIADITGAEDLKISTRGIQRNLKQAAEKPQPTRTASFTEGGAEL